MFKILGLILLLFIGIVVISFTTLNAQTIQLNYYFGSMDLPLAVAVVVSIAAGILFGFFASLGSIMRLKRENLKLKRTTKAVEKQLAQPRPTPVQEN